MIVVRGNAAAPSIWRVRGPFQVWRWFAQVQRGASQRGPQGAPGAQTAAPGATPGGSAESAFAAFVAAHEDAVYAYLWRATGDAQTAYDLRQETFIRAWRRFEQVRDYERPLAWLYRVATNLALNERRDRRTIEPLLGADELASSDPAWRLAERDLVQQTFQAMPARERLALALRSGQGFSCEEVAEVMDISGTAARSLLWRARERFRTIYEAADTERQGGGR